MSTDVLSNNSTDQSQNPVRLISGIVKDAQELLKQQIELLQIEVEDDLRQTTQASITLVMGMAVALVGAILLAFGLVELASFVMPRWVAYGLIGLVIAGGGAGLITAAFVAFSKINPLPEKTAEGLKENLQWQTRQN